MKIFCTFYKEALLYRINIIILSFVINLLPYLSINSQNMFAIIFLRGSIILLTDEYSLEKNMLVLN